MIAVDFFCGAGGLTSGLSQAGISVILGIDNDKHCGETYEKNNNSSKFLGMDLRELKAKQIRHFLSGVNRKDLLFAACAPCQPFTKLNNRRNRGTAATLLGRFSYFVSAFRPGAILLENVPGITKVSGFSTYRRFLKTLEQVGYHFCEGIVDAKFYGVPQTRRRFILIAMTGTRPTLPTATHGPGLIPFETVEKAISHYPGISAGECHPKVPNHRASVLSPLNLRRIRNTPLDGGDRRSWPKRVVLNCHRKGHKGHTDVYGRMWWNRPAPALTCRCDSLSNGRFGHPAQDRAISLREAASLQSFPDSYVFHGPSKEHITAQIGNAVPVRLAEALGRHILQLRCTKTE